MNKVRLWGLRALRIERGMTQEQLAEAANYATDTVRRIENGQQGFSMVSIETLSATLNAPWWRLFGFDSPPTVSLEQCHRDLAELIPELTADMAATLASIAGGGGQFDSRRREVMVELAHVVASADDRGLDTILAIARGVPVGTTERGANPPNTDN